MPGHAKITVMPGSDILAAASLMPIVLAPASICAMAYTIAPRREVHQVTDEGWVVHDVGHSINHAVLGRGPVGPSTQPTIDVSPPSSRRQISIERIRSLHTALPVRV